jgi:hypothetical protein
MGLTLTTVTPGDPIDATAMRAANALVEHYVNEEIGAADLKTSAPWIEAMTIVRPRFSGGPDSGRTAWFEGATCEVHYFYMGDKDVRRAMFHTPLFDGETTASASTYVPIVGMTRTISLPEVISSGALPQRRVNVLASWYCYEYGGHGVWPDESASRVADFVLMIDGDTKPSTARSLWKASYPGLSGTSLPMFRKQYGIQYPATISSIGIHHFGVRLRLTEMTLDGGFDDNWRHIFVADRSMVVEVPYR